MTDTSSNPSSTTPPPDDWRAQYNEHQRREAEIFTVNKTALLQALLAAGISIVVITFDGYADSGQIEHIEARAGETQVTLPKTDVHILQLVWGETEPRHFEMSLDAAVQTLFWDILSAKHDGWENNDGGFGEFTVNVSANRITLDYNDRFTDIENYQHAF